MAIAINTDLNPDRADTGLARIVEFADREAESRTVAASRSINSFLLFICELRRRRVCRAAAFYVVTFWLVCQVLDVVAPALDLPEWTLKLVIVLGLILFPVALVLSWLIDITPQGLVADVGGSAPVESTRVDTRVSRIIDCALLAASAVIALQLSAGLFIGDAVRAHDMARRVAVNPFRHPGWTWRT